jgi:hypothetical protein
MNLVGIGCLLALGEGPARIAGENGVPLFHLATLERQMWAAADCPLCAAGVPL